MAASMGALYFNAHTRMYMHTTDAYTHAYEKLCYDATIQARGSRVCNLQRGASHRVIPNTGHMMSSLTFPLEILWIALCAARGTISNPRIKLFPSSTLMP